MRIGIDLGGTKIEGVLLAEDGREIDRFRLSTPQGDYQGTLKAVADLVKRLDGIARADGFTSPPPVGVGIPGATSPASGLVKNANSVCLIGHDLGGDLSSAIGREARLANDANCFAVSEAHDGAGAGAHVVFGVIIGTGVGGGVSVGGHALTGPNAIAGEWGHNPLPWPQSLDGQDERPGPRCYCGKSGCVETFLSGPGISNDHHAHNGARLDAHEIADQAARGDDACDATLRRYEHRLARALATVINVLDPDVIVLGGGLSNIERLYDNVPKLWKDWVFSDDVLTRIVPNRHGDSSGVRGAAWLWD